VIPNSCRIILRHHLTKAEMKSLAEKDIELFNASMKQWQANQITSQKYADILEKRYFLWPLL
jgi:hypothetical protein